MVCDGADYLRKLCGDSLGSGLGRVQIHDGSLMRAVYCTVPIDLI